MPSLISLAILNRNGQHVRSQGREQERDEGWFFHSRGVSRGNVGAGARAPGRGRAGAKECGGASDQSEGDGMAEGDFETGKASGLESSCQTPKVLWFQ